MKKRLLALVFAAAVIGVIFAARKHGERAEKPVGGQNVEGTEPSL